ncbi:Fe-S-containing hydro-lyase [Oceanobacillus profundus]|uniref:Fe-S-containing hydro-lyase n=1 Tax=Oceanobacillus TaxID=182709 RepID=UPI0026E20BCA|nr:Fe-S-containing hydro-lyase [Oceanobacillus profundus]MDO6448642.1 Fe-S-containing hydro-lyase [Oceanobacillus profundus]
MVQKKISVPFNDEGAIKSLQAGDQVLLSGTIFTARDAAHKRMVEQLEKVEKLPVDLTNQVIYYVGPTPARPGDVIGSAGPTTSSRMDKYTPCLLEKGLKGMIGKGYRSQAVIDAIVKNDAVYFAAIGGSGALLAKRIKSVELVAYEDLGTEAIRKLEIEDFPCMVINDSEGNDWYKESQAAYKKSKE